MAVTIDCLRLDCRLVHVACSCGADWVHSPDVLQDEVDSIFQSHIAYAKRTAMRPD